MPLTPSPLFLCLASLARMVLVPYTSACTRTATPLTGYRMDVYKRTGLDTPAVCLLHLSQLVHLPRLTTPLPPLRCCATISRCFVDTLVPPACLPRATPPLPTTAVTTPRSFYTVRLFTHTHALRHRTRFACASYHTAPTLRFPCGCASTRLQRTTNTAYTGYRTPPHTTVAKGMVWFPSPCLPAFLCRDCNFRFALRDTPTSAAGRTTSTGLSACYHTGCLYSLPG